MDAINALLPEKTPENTPHSQDNKCMKEQINPEFIIYGLLQLLFLFQDSSSPFFVYSVLFL